MANTPANITQLGYDANTTFVDTLNQNLNNLRDKDVGNYNELKGYIDGNETDIENKLAAHKTSTDHPADKITYSGKVTGATNTKQAIDSLQSQVDEITAEGSIDPEVSQAHVDVEGNTYDTLKAVNDAWQMRTKALENRDADTLDGKHASDFAPGGFGLGGIGIRLAKGTDLNTIINNGWYDVENPLNGVSGLTWHKLLVIASGDVDYVTQLAFSMIEGNEMYIRTKIVGTWSGWSKIAKITDIPTSEGDADTLKGYTAEATPANADNTAMYEVVYDYGSENTTIPEITYSYAINRAAQADQTAAGLNDVTKRVSSIEDILSVLIVMSN